MNESDKSIRGYNRLARIYRWLEWPLFRGQLQQARTSMIGDLPRCDRVLLLGDGDGRLLKQLCRAQPACQVTSVDQSAEMLRLQTQRTEQLGASQRVTFICQDARDFRPSGGSYDLLVTAFFLDCFGEQELARLVPQWLAGVRPGGLFYFVDFTQPKSGWQRQRAEIYLTILHWFFRWQTGLSNRRLVNFDAILAGQRIALVASQTRNRELMSSRLYRVTDERKA